MVNFRAQFAKETSEIEEEFHANQDKKAALRAKRLTDFMEFWTGSLDSAQKAKAQEIARDLPDLTAMRLAYRAHGMAQVERLVREKAGKEKTRDFLRSFWLLPGARPDPVAKQYSNESWKSFRTGTERMDGILTKEQRKKAADKMIELPGSSQDLTGIKLKRYSLLILPLFMFCRTYVDIQPPAKGSVENPVLCDQPEGQRRYLRLMDRTEAP